MGNVLDKNAVLDRVKQCYKLKGNADLARFLGVSPNTITNWYSRKSLDIDAIYTNCVECNFHWLLTGKGPMLRTDGEPTLPAIPSTDTSTPSDTVVLRLMEKLDEKDAKIDLLQSELRQQSAELAALKAQHPETSIPHTEVLNPAKNASTKKPSSPPNADNATSANAQ